MVVEILPPPVFTVTVHGFPRPQGSKSAFVNKATGRAQMSESSGPNLKDWRANVQVAATQARRDTGAAMIAHPVQTVIEFRFPRPKSHYGTGRNARVLKATAPAYPVSIGRHGDLEKLERAVNDALTAAGVWVDDILVVASQTEKNYAADETDAGATITVFARPSTITEPKPWTQETR